MAFGGMMGAVAMVIMCMGGLIPVATYVCPMLCILILALVLRRCGSRIAWAWYGAVALLSLLLAPDREAAAVFVFLGYYPILKPWIDRRKGKWLLKALLFNSAIGIMYFCLIFLMGGVQLVEELRETGIFFIAVLVLMGNLVFFLTDKVLTRFGGGKYGNS